MDARRTKIKLTFEGTDITEDINKYLQSMTYTDNSEDESDDFQIVLDDREDIWIGNWLNSSQSSGKGAEISATIVQSNFSSANSESVLDCGIFQVDTVSFSGFPTKVTIKATAIPSTSTIKNQKKTKAWEQLNLSEIASEIASRNGLSPMFESSKDPYFNRVEQVSESDIAFLKRLCKKTGISLKVTAKLIVLFLSSEYESKGAVDTLKKGESGITKYSFSTTFVDASYGSCHVQYTDSSTNETYDAVFNCPDGENTGQVLEINEKVESNAEALEVATMRLREKNKGEYSASFTTVGNPGLVGGLTVNVSGYGTFDGKYIIETATHKVSSSGYTTDLKLRQVLEGY